MWIRRLASGLGRSAWTGSRPVLCAITCCWPFQPEDFNLLKPQLERVPLPVGTRLVEPNTPIEHVYFLEEGIASVVATTPQGRRIEAGIIGREGLSGIPVLLGWIAPRTSALSRPRVRACGSGPMTFGARWRPVHPCTNT